MKIPLDEYLTKKRPQKKQAIVDHWSMQTFSFIAGTILDFGYSGLGLGGWISSRIQGAIGNKFTASTYGKWRDTIYNQTKTGKSSSKIKKIVSETLAFETFQVPLYGGIVTLASIIEQLAPGTIQDGLDHLANTDYVQVLHYAVNKGLNGMQGAFELSIPLIFASKYTTNKFRKLYNLKTPEEKVSEVTK